MKVIFQLTQFHQQTEWKPVEDIFQLQKVVPTTVIAYFVLDKKSEKPCYSLYSCMASGITCKNSKNMNYYQ